MKAIHLQIPADADYIDLVRICLFGVASKLGFSFEAIEDMKVAVSEACNNAILPKMDSGRADVIEVVFESYESALSVRVIHSGTTSDQTGHYNADPPVIKGDERSELTVRGLGVYLMEALMDEVHMCSDEDKMEFMLIKYCE